jgi:transposase
LTGYGIVTKNDRLSSKKGLAAVLLYSVPELAKLGLDVIVFLINSLNEGISRLDDQITDQGQHLKGLQNIISIKGIGPQSGAILLSIIGDIYIFFSEKKLHAFFGIVPRLHQSNQTFRTGRFIKEGSKLGRTTLVQCTLIAIRYSPYVNSFYQQLKMKEGSGNAIIATAKKLLGIIYSILKNDWIFEDFTKFVLAN